MSDKSIVDSCQHFPAEASRQQSLKGIHGPDNSMPLSPQWLQTKSGDNKEHHTSMCHGEHVDSMKGSTSGEDFHERGKRKDAYKLVLHDTETGSRDRWRDEERETNSAIRRDPRGERWSDNSQRFSGEARHTLSERLSELGNREGSFDQRRESKWNTRWGPADKESESWREKWPESGKDGEGPREKMSHLTSLGRDSDKEGEQHSRSWRSNSFMSRGKAESYYPSLTPNKQTHMFGYGRGKGENGAPLSPAGRGRFNSSNATSGALRPYHLGAMSAKFDGLHSGSSPLRYSRMKLLDIYRMTEIRNHKLSLDGIIEVPSLTQSEPLEPLALSAPTNEELVILKAIDKGEISSSGVPQVSKESTVGRNAVDPAVPKQMKLGSQEDLQFVGVDYTNDGCESKKIYDAISPKVDPAKRAETPFKKADDLTGEMGMPESRFPCNVAPWRSLSADSSQWSSPDWRNSSSELAVRSPDVNWSHLSNDLENEASRAAVLPSFCKDELSWQNSENRSNLKRYASEISDREQSANLFIAPEVSLSSRVQPTSRNFQPYPSPEELSLYYKDPHGQVQGPFSGSDIIGWFETGYFGINLEVRLAGAPPDAPFLLLGDVIPQLRLKVRAPPGFSAAKQSNILDMSIGEKTVSNVLSTYSGVSGYELSKSGQKSGILVSTEAENKFLESQMFANMSSSTVGNLSEGLHSHGVHGPAYSSSAVGESGNGVNYLLAQKRLEQQQNSLNNSVPFLSGKDSSLMALNMAITADSSDPYLKIMPLTGNPSHLASQSLQQSDLLSLLHAGQVDKSPSSAVITGASAWSKLPDAQMLNNNVHAGLDIHKNKLDIHQNQHHSSQFGFVGQQQQLRPQNLPSLSHLINKPVDISGLVPSEQLLASDAAQDPQMLNLLAHHYLLSQPPIPQPQVSLPSQLSLLNECLLLKQQLQQQQQKQEQQKQLLLQQQQFLLSQVLSGHQSGQPHFVESSQKLHSVVPEGNVLTDHLQLRQIQEAQINQNIPVSNLHDGHGSTIQTANLEDSEYTNNSSNCEPSLLHLSHQIFDHASHSKEHESGPRGVGDNGASHVSLTSGIAETSVFHALQKTENSFPATENAIDHKKYAKQTSTSMPESREFMPSECSVLPQEVSGVSDFVSPISDQIHDLKISSDDIIDQHHADVSAIKDSKNLETFQAKKSAKKKSRKKKNSKSQLAMDLLMGFSNANQLEQPKPKLETIQFEQPKSKLETGNANSHGLSAAHTNLLKPPHASLTAVDDLSSSSAVKPVDSQQSRLPPSCTNMDREVENLNDKAECTEGSISELSNLRAWKSAPGFKAKSLKEIQHEEQQQRVKMASEIERFSPSGPVSSPWTGVVGSFDHKIGKDTSQGAFSTEFTSSSDSNLISKTRKSQLHDLLAEEVLAESSGVDVGIARDNKGHILPFVSSTAAQLDVAAINDENFIEAKDTKKDRKKGSKAKAAGAKASSPVGSFDLPSTPSAAEKGKFEDQTQHEKELLPAPPTGPSLADFVFWKGEQTNSSKAPAWSMDSGKFQKPTSLRDIQKEQEKKLPVQQNIPIPSTEKAQSNQGNRRLGSWQVPVSSPSSGSTPMQSSSLNSRQVNPKIEDDLFWGPDQSKQETVKPDFPSLGNSNNWSAKGSPARASPVAISRQKPSGYRAGDHSPSATGSIMSSSRGKKVDEPGNLSEAMGFRDWCEKELARLTGLNDTSFLEYCLKQSTTEAEILLKENIGSLDRNHEFIDKFLSYKDFLSPKVIEMAFQARSAPGNRDAGTALDLDADAEVGKGGNKKGKKGKKVSPAVLGFNVMSNRIMMGEIQNVED